MGRKITVDIAATGSVDGSFTSAMSQMQSALKSVKAETKGAGSSFTNLTKQLTGQRSALKELEKGYAAAFATGDLAGADNFLNQIITMRGAMEQNQSVINGMKTAMQSLSNIDGTAAAGISKLTTEISQQEGKLQQLQNEYQQACSTYGTNSNEAQQLASQIQRLTTEIDQNNSALEQQMNSIKQAAQSMSQYSNQAQEAQTAISKQKAELAQLKSAYTGAFLKEGQGSATCKELGNAIESLSNELRQNESAFEEASAAADRYDNSLSGAQGKTKGWKDSFVGNMLGNMASDALYRGLDVAKDFTKGIFSTGMGFESQMARVQGISKASTSDMARLTSKAEEMGASTIYSATEAGEALEYMALAGWDTQKSIDSLEPVLKLAAGAGMDLGQTSDLVTDFMGAFNKSSMSVQDFANKLVIASTSSNTEVSQMGEAFRNSAAGMNAMGQSVDTTSAVLSVLADNGIKGSRAGTQLSAIMRDMNHHMENGAIQIGKTSVAVADAQGNYRQLTDIIKDVDKATEGMSETERTAALSSIFTQDSQMGMYTLLDAQNGLLEDRMKLLSNETMDQEALNTLYHQQTDTLEGSLAIFKSGLTAIQKGLYDVLKPMAKSALDWVNQNIMPGLTSFVSNLKSINWNEAFGGIKDFFSDLWSGMGDSGHQVLGAAGIGAGIFAAFKGLGKAKDLFGNLFSGNPFQALITGAQSAAGQTKGIFASLGTGIGNVFKGLGKGIQSVFQGIGSVNLGSFAGLSIVIATVSASLAGLSMIGQPVIDFLHGLTDVLLQLTGGILQQFADFIVRVSDVFPQFCSGLAELSPLIDSVGNSISKVIQSIGDALAQILPVLQPIVETIGTTISRIAEIIGNVIIKVVEAIAPHIPEITSMIETISTTIGKIADDISNMFAQVSPILDSLGNAFEKFGNMIRNALDGVADIIESVGNVIEKTFNGLSGLVEAVGDAFMKAGIGFDLFAVGCERLNGLNLMGIAGSLLLMIPSLTALGGLGGGINDLGEGMLYLAIAVERLIATGSQIPAVVSSIQMLGTGLTETSATMQSAAGVFSSASTQISGYMTVMAGYVMACSNIIVQNLAKLGPAFMQTFSQMVSAVQMGQSAIIAGLMAITTAFTNMISVVGSAMSGILSVVQSACAGLLSVLTACASNMVAIMSAGVNGMVSVFSAGVSGLISIAGAAFAGVATTIQAAMARGVAAVQAGVAAMQAALSVTIEGPHVAVPHFSMSGTFDIKTGAVPTISVSYYKKGGIMDGPTLFGMSGTSLNVGGEAGAEAILPLDPFWNRLDGFLDNLLGLMRPTVFDGVSERGMASLLGSGGSGATINSQPVINFSPTITINSSATNASELASEVRDQMEEQERRLFEKFKQMMEEEAERGFRYA